MNHHWHVHPEHERPIRYCCECNAHQTGIWYLDHLANIFLVQWEDDQSECKVSWDISSLPGEDIRQANWRFN